MKKHILVISQYFYPEQFRINDLTCEWVKQGYKVTVLTGIPNYPAGKFYDGYGWFKKRKETWNGIDIIRIPLIARGHSAVGMVLNYFSFVISGFLWKCFTKVKADLVFTFEVSPMTQALIGVWYSKRRKIPNYLYVQDLWPENVEIVTGIRNSIVIKPISKMVNYIYKNCDKIFATSPSFVNEIQKRLNKNKEKVIYLPQYAEDFYKETTKKSDLIPQDDVLNITFTGNVGNAQGLEILPVTAKILKENNMLVRFNIVGDGRNKENLLKQIAENNVEEYFNMVGRVPATDIPDILSASDAAFLSFAENELFQKTIPAKLQSYMACACAIIGAVDGESKRIIEESGAGIVSKIGDAKSLADAIVEFSVASLQDKEKMRASSLAYCEKHFDKSKLINFLNNEIGLVESK